MKKMMHIGFLILATFCQISLASYHLGYQYYEQDNYGKAFYEFKQAAQYGDKDAQYNLGAMYYYGEHVKRDLIESYAWFSLASQNPNYAETGIDKKILASLSEKQQAKAKDRQKLLFSKYSDDALKKSLSPVLDEPQYDKANNYHPLKRKMPEYPKSQLRRGANGWVDVIFTIEKSGVTRDHTIYYSTNDDFRQSSLEAMRHWQFKPNTANGQAVTTTGVRHRLHFAIQGSEPDRREISRTLAQMKRDAEKGGGDEQFRFAYFLDSLQQHVDHESLQDNPITWFEKAAHNGHAIAAYFIGMSLLTGHNCEADSYKSLGWLLRAATQNVADAQYTLAIEHLSGNQLEKDETEGLYWLERAASGMLSAKIRYAWILVTHPDVNIRDPARAQSLLAEIENDYIDKQALWETRAAVAAETGDFETAIHWQQQALEDAAALDLPLEISQQKLEHYQSDKPWRERL